jgi:CheY-like chemotaxis protein
MSTTTPNLVRTTNSLGSEKPQPSEFSPNYHQYQTIKSLPLEKGLLRVLIVDDDKDTVDSMGMLVEFWKHDVAKAYDSATALKMAATYRPHVLLMDVAMPHMSGCAVAQLLQQQQRCLPKSLLIALTGCHEQSSLCKQAGFDYFFLKPVNLATLEQLLFMEQKRLARRVVVWSSVSIPADRFSLPSESNSLPGIASK